MRFGKLDLNLLVALDALLQERSVSQASNRIHLSQSATSNALARLRDYFQDDLLVLKGRQMVLTQRAEQLVEPVRDILEQIGRTIAVPQPFDPAVSDRIIRIMASDYVIEVLLSTALLEMSDEAPGMRFEVLTFGDEPDVAQDMLRGRGDLLLTIDSAISTEHPSIELFQDDFVIVGWSGNPVLTGAITKELYEQLGHVMTRFGRDRVPSFEEWALRSQSIKRRIEIVAPDFTSVSAFLAGSERIATVHRKLATRMVKIMPLKILEAPFQIPGIHLMAQWATSSSNDPALAWTVQRLQQVAATL